MTGSLEASSTVQWRLAEEEGAVSHPPPPSKELWALVVEVFEEVCTGLLGASSNYCSNYAVLTHSV